MYTKELLEIKKLLESIRDTEKPQMRWMWGEALLGYSMSLMDEYMEGNDFLSFLTAYADYYTCHKPRVDYADTAAPALITYYVEKKTGREDVKHLTDRVLDYIKNEPRILDDAVNHLGKSPESRFYPASIWVDSLMMFSVFPSLYGRERNDRKLLDIAARQPRLYSSYMQDKDTGLWYHSYWVRSRRAYPGRGLYWGRGNGWVVSALPKILDNLPADHPERPGILAILEKTCREVIKYQNDNGSFNTLLGIESYEETSATALIADGLLHSINCSYLSGSEYKDSGIRAFKAVMDNLHEKDGRYYLENISAPTIPTQLIPGLVYKLTPRAANFKYGVAAAAFAAIEYDRLSKASTI